MLTQRLENTGLDPAKILRLLRHLTVTLAYAAAVSLLDPTGLLITTGSISRPVLTLLLFLEGGLGLIIRVATARSSGLSTANQGGPFSGPSLFLAARASDAKQNNPLNPDYLPTF